MATPIEQIAPRQISSYKVVIESPNGTRLDITPHVIEMSIFESIYAINMHGQLVIGDNSAIFSDLPIVGQENINIQFTRMGEDVDLDFVVSGVEDISSPLESVGAYVILFTAKTKLLNTVSESSKSYKGLGVDIIREIYDDKFGIFAKLDVKASGGSSMRVVMPFIKPFAAINMIQQTAYDTNKSPLFIFDTVYDENPQLTSLHNMMTQEPVHHISNRVNFNNAEDGMSTRDILEYTGQAQHIEIPSAYSVFEQIAAGSYATSIDTVDISNKSIRNYTFDHTKHAVVDNDYMHANFKINDRLLSEHTGAHNAVNYINTKAFDSLGNIYGSDSYARPSVDSRLNRLDTINMNIQMDSVPGVAAGKTITVDYKRFVPMVTDQDTPKDEINSGKYLISSLRHYIKLGEYTMSLNLVRSHVGDS
jgi:hypothetical protein